MMAQIQTWTQCCTRAMSQRIESRKAVLIANDGRILKRRA